MGSCDVEAVDSILRARRPWLVDAGRSRRLLELEADADHVTPGICVGRLCGLFGGEGVIVPSEDVGIHYPVREGGREEEAMSF